MKNIIFMQIIKTDLDLTKFGIDIYRKKNSESGMKRLAAYHIQQAAEKLIRIQINKYLVDTQEKPFQMHDIGELIRIAESLNRKVYIPNSIRKNCNMLTEWEYHTRYTIDYFLSIVTVKKLYKECLDWYNILWKQGYR